MTLFDLAGFHLLNQWAGHLVLVDKVLAFFAQYALEIYAVLFVMAWFALPKHEVNRRHALVIMGLSGILALLFNFIISHIWFRPRPFVTLPKGTFTQLIPHSPDASFPSDHTAGGYGFAAASWPTTNRWVKVSFTCIAIIVMIARVYTGVHWPTDVLAAMLIGVLSAGIMWLFSPFLLPITNFGLRLLRLGTTTK